MHHLFLLHRNDPPPVPPRPPMQNNPPPIPGGKPRIQQVLSGPKIAGDIFEPITPLNEPPPIASRPDHPMPKDLVRTRSVPIWQMPQVRLGPPPSTPLQTNKFYANFMMGSQSNGAWPQPYSVCWSKGRGNANSWGISITHIEQSQVAFGPTNDTGASNFFFGPIGIQHMCLSAAELGGSTALYVDDCKAFSVNVSLCPSADAPPILTFPMCQGMGFVTGVYTGCTPCVQSSVFIRTVQPCGTINNGVTEKYRCLLEDGRTWLVYRTFSQGSNPGGPLRSVSNSTLQGDAGFVGTIQVAKLPQGCPEDMYDNSAGAYPIACEISATIHGDSAQYCFSWMKAGLQKPLLMMALPHHVATFDSNTSRFITPLRLETITKGVATGVIADQWMLVEKIPIDMGFAPWHPSRGSIASLSHSACSSISTVGASEVDQDVKAQCCLDSMYFSGKGLAKFAMLVYVLHDIAHNPDLAVRGLSKLKDAFNVFVTNQQRNPLVYEQSWKGSVSVAGLGGDWGQDFGNSYYNDHHFHFGYFCYTAAVIGYLDPSWLSDRRNRAWVNMLVRDFANPVCDEYFPFSRSFDWYNGHSWAKGLFESADGKDQESSSEDGFASYALKMWGRISGNPKLEATGDLRLGIQKTVFNKYFLMEMDGSHQPARFIANKVSGILFENKCDHATYFGGNIEYIQGIHMIPIAAPSAWLRSEKYVREEWESYFSNGRVDQVAGGWRGICYMNLAIIDPRTAYSFFNQPNFDWGWLDGGMSRAWCLAYCAALGGA